MIAVTARHKTRSAPMTLGMVLFLISEAFLFGSLFWTYFYLRGKTAAEWPPAGVHLRLALVSLNTVILLASSGTAYAAVRAIRAGSRRGLVAGILATMLLGSAFLGVTAWEWANATFRPWSHAYGSIFYTMTGFHGLHVLGGLLLWFVLLVRALRGLFSQERYLALEVGSLYWHFVDLVWLGVFTSLFIIR